MISKFRSPKLQASRLGECLVTEIDGNWPDIVCKSDVFPLAVDLLRHTRYKTGAEALQCGDAEVNEHEGSA